ncbi:MAG: phosphodiester glycosidase family protein [Patescibacteria group bacterium]
MRHIYTDTMIFKTPVLVGMVVVIITVAVFLGVSPWNTITTGLRTIEFGGKLLVYEIDPSLFSFSLASSTTPLSLSQWREKTGAEIVINGGYFHQDYSPSGALVIDGKLVSSRAFDQDRSALLAINSNGKPEILNLATDPVSDFTQFEFALQSYPMLIDNGAEMIAVDSGLLARRTLIGTDVENNIYLMIFDSEPISLFGAMKFLKKIPIELTDVLNLDGGPSTGISIAIEDYQTEILSGAPGVPNVLLIKSTP